MAAEVKGWKLKALKAVVIGLVIIFLIYLAKLSKKPRVKPPSLSEVNIKYHPTKDVTPQNNLSKTYKVYVKTKNGPKLVKTYTNVNSQTTALERLNADVIYTGAHLYFSKHLTLLRYNIKAQSLQKFPFPWKKEIITKHSSERYPLAIRFKVLDDNNFLVMLTDNSRPLQIFLYSKGTYTDLSRKLYTSNDGFLFCTYGCNWGSIVYAKENKYLIIGDFGDACNWKGTLYLLNTNTHNVTEFHKFGNMHPDKNGLFASWNGIWQGKVLWGYYHKEKPLPAQMCETDVYNYLFLKDIKSEKDTLIWKDNHSLGPISKIFINKEDNIILQNQKKDREVTSYRLNPNGTVTKINTKFSREETEEAKDLYKNVLTDYEIRPENNFLEFVIKNPDKTL